MSQKSVSQVLARLRSDRRGSVAILFGLLAAPLVGAAGLGIDYTRAVSYRIQLEKAANEAALSAIDTARAMTMADPNIAPETVMAAAQERATRVFNARAPKQFNSIFNSAINVNRIGNTISANTDFTGALPTLFGNIVGIHTISVAGDAKASGALGRNASATGSDDPNVIVNENFSADTGTLEGGVTGHSAETSTTG